MRRVVAASHRKGPGGRLALVAACLLAATAPARAQSTTDVLNTAHNLSVTGTGVIRAVAETRVCIFCHTPHNAAPMSPLWNKDLQPQVYTVYTSPTLAAGTLPQPTGPTKLCLTCHDGTIAMGAVLNPSTGIPMAGADVLAPDSLSNFGLDLSTHHPVSFSYQASLPNTELAPTPPADLTFGGADEVHCTTCHDPHSDQFGKFLVKDNRYSALCTTCHQIDDWAGSAHATSSASVTGVLPRPPKTWPNYPTLAEWGCETCHTPHFAPTGPELLNFTSDPPEPFSCTSAGCHSSDPAPPHLLSSSDGKTVMTPGATPRVGVADIAAQIRKPSAHHERPGTIEMRAAQGNAQGEVSSVTCTDCHNPHIGAGTEATAPEIPGALRGIGGVDRNGIDVATARFEYEVCLKCHGDNSLDVDFVPRVLRDNDKRRSFDPSNASYHPVMAMGKAPNVPSIPSSLEPDMSAFSLMYCSTCHADDDGVTKGPHGSTWAPILKERYEVADNTTESYENYALCYRCHDRNSILADQSFRPGSMASAGAAGAGGGIGRMGGARTTPSGGGHSGHLAAGAPCAACHEPHGVSEWGQADAASTGSHTHLINFSTAIVSPKPGATAPVFFDKGMFTGSCDLVCHNVLHEGATYP